MARTKKADTTAITSNEEVMVDSVEKTTEKKVEKPETTPANAKVWIKNPSCAYKRIRVSVEVYPFDSEGKAYVTQEDAKLFLTHAGYELVK